MPKELLTVEEFGQVWANRQLRNAIEARLRSPGGMHEWLPVSRANVFKRWGVTAEQIAELRTPTSTTRFVNPAGRHGGEGSTTAHNELLRLVDESSSYAEYVSRLQAWAARRLEAGLNGLPLGLRPPVNKEETMDDAGIVSAWIGTAASRKIFDEALEAAFSEDGDFLGSPFSRAVGIGYYDEDFKEAEYREASTRRLSELLQRVSYTDLVVPRLSSLLSSEIEANCFVLLYNYRHMGPRTWSAEGVSLQYLGAVAYR